MTLRYFQLQTMGGLTTEAAPSLSVFQLETGFPSYWHWNGGVQFMLPWAAVLDVSYTGEHAYNIVEDTNINAIDFGAAFLSQNQDPTVTSSIPGGAAVSADLMRAFCGYGNITQEQPRGWITSHLLAISITRRFSKGLSFGFNDSVVLQQKSFTTARLQHNPDGTFSYRADQKVLRTAAHRYAFAGSYLGDGISVQNRVHSRKQEYRT